MSLLCIGLLMAVVDHEPPSITHQPVSTAVRALPLVLEARIADESGVFAQTVYARPIGEGGFQRIVMRRAAAQYRATIPARLMRTDLEYFIEAFDERGNGPARVGSPEAPMVVRVHEPIVAQPRKPAVLPADVSKKAGIESEWWFWTLLVAAVAGGAVGGYFVLRPSEVDTVTLGVSGPNPAGGGF